MSKSASIVCHGIYIERIPLVVADAVSCINASADHRDESSCVTGSVDRLPCINASGDQTGPEAGDDASAGAAAAASTLEAAIAGAGASAAAGSSYAGFSPVTAQFF